MKNLSLFLLIGVVAMSAAACTPPTAPGDDGAQTSSEQMRETPNVLYRGVLQDAGVTIYMEGTHRLTLDDGRFILLESDAVMLDEYVGRRVEVLGAIRPTVEPGGQIMRVQLVRLQSASSVPASSVASSEPAEDAASSAAAQASSVPAPASSVAQQPRSPAPVASSAPDGGQSDALTEKARTMAQADLSAANWTREYCSTHWAFCMPVHRNWYFTSFGATAASLWHVEIGPQAIENIGEGPLVVNLVNGSATADGEVRVQGDTAVGQRAWEGGRHFEVRAPAVLEDAVRTLVEGLKPAAQ